MCFSLYRIMDDDKCFLLQKTTEFLVMLKLQFMKACESGAQLKKPYRIIYEMTTVKSSLIIPERFSLHLNNVQNSAAKSQCSLVRNVRNWNAKESHRYFQILPIHPANYDKQAIHSQNTWAGRCTGWSFVSTTKQSKLKRFGWAWINLIWDISIHQNFYIKAVNVFYGIRRISHEKH